jgi:hypothetical protein
MFPVTLMDAKLGIRSAAAWFWKKNIHLSCRVISVVLSLNFVVNVAAFFVTKPLIQVMVAIAILCAK